MIVYDHGTRLRIYGLSYGYPRCCIEDFVLFATQDNPQKRAPRKLNGTGFVPCEACNSVKSEEQLVQEINRNRNSELPAFRPVAGKKSSTRSQVVHA